MTEVLRHPLDRRVASLVSLDREQPLLDVALFAALHVITPEDVDVTACLEALQKDPLLDQGAHLGVDCPLGDVIGPH